MHNPNKINEGNNLPKEGWLGIRAAALLKVFSKKESDNGDVEKKNLLHKNGEKIVIARSNGETVLGVIVGSMRGQYKVLYNIGNQIREKDLSEKEIAAAEEVFAGNHLENSVQDGPDYKIGEEVLIPRTNKEPSKGYIIGYNEKTGEYSVGFADKEEVFSKGVSGKTQGKKATDAVIMGEKFVGKSKTLMKEDLDKYNS